MVTTEDKHVLIVDDASDIRATLQDFLCGEGYKVTVAANGLEALSFLRATDELPNIIFLDLMMPEMDGYQFRQEQEKDPKVAHIPVIIMTADGHIQAKSLKAGAKGYLKKPFSDLETILNTVEQILKQ